MEFVGIYKELDKWKIKLEHACANYNPSHNILEHYYFLRMVPFATRETKFDI